MQNPCWQRVTEVASDILSHIESKGIRFNPDTGEGKAEYLAAAKELRAQSVNDLASIHAQIKGEPEKVKTEPTTAAEPSTVVGDVPEKVEPKKDEGKDFKAADQKAGNGNGVPPEPPKVETIPEEESTGIAHAETEKVREKYNLGDYERNNSSDAQMEARADEAIARGYNPGTLVKQMESGIAPSGVENFIIKKYLATLEGVFDKDPTDANMAPIERLVKATDKIGSLQSEAFRTRKGLVPVDDSLAGFFIQEKESNQDAPLTDGQKATVKAEWEKISEAKKKFEEYVSQREAEFAKKQAEAELGKQKPKTKPSERKTHEDHVKYREQVVKDIREKLKKARGETSATIVPYAKELFAIAPDVAKLVKDLLEEGVSKLEDVVKNIHEQLKSDLPDLTERDVHDIIAGEYAEKQRPRNEIAKQLFDLREEAKLINRLEKLEEGIEPKNEKEKIKRNQEIESLRKQIKEHDLTKLSKYKSSTKSQIEKLETELKEAPKEAPKVQPLKLDSEGQALRDRLIKLKQERQLRIMKIQYTNRSRYEKARDNVLEVLNVPRTIMASMDYSAPLRQGIVASIAHPSLAAKAGIEMFRQSVSQKRFDRWFHDIKESPRYDLMIDSDLQVTDPHDLRLSQKEEAFMNNLAEKIPIVGKFIKGSERAYVGYLNKLRVDIFNQFTDNLESRGRTFDNSPELYKKMAGYINNSTGRGSLGKIETYAPVLNTVFFSPRLIASRLNLINPIYYAKLPPEIRVSALKDMAKFIGVGLTVLALAKLNGAEVEDDPRSTDFGKIKSGDTRWDVWGGFQQYIRVLTQMFLGQKKSTGTGEIAKLDGSGRFGETRADVGSRFARGKLAPVPSMAVDFLSGRNATGQETTIASEALSHLLPLLYSDVQQAVKDQGVKAIFTVGVPSTFGVGVSTYQSSKPAHTLQIYDTPTSQKPRDATPEEIKAYKDLRAKKLEQKLQKMETSRVGLNAHGKVTLDKKPARYKEANLLTPEERKKLMELYGEQATREAKKEKHFDK